MKSRHFLLVAAFILATALTPALRAAETNATDITPATLTAFMEKWKDYEAGKTRLTEADQPLLLAALAKEPSGPWYGYLVVQFPGGPWYLRGPQNAARQAEAAKAAATLKQADQILTAAIARGPANAADLTSEQAMIQQALSPYLLAAGPAYLPEARALGQRMLDHPPATNSWDYGNVVFAGNALLGQVALREGKLEAARSYLRAAGRAPATPQLSSFGPGQFFFPRELLEHGEPADREAVLSFLDDIAHFWASPKANIPNDQAVAGRHLKELVAWKEQIRAGKIPDNPRWR